MALFANPPWKANYFVGHLSRVGALRQPVKERFGCRKRSCVGQRLRVLNARLHRCHTTLKQSLCQQRHRLKASCPAESLQYPAHRRCGAAGVTADYARNALTEGVTLRPIERLQRERNCERKFLPVLRGHLASQLNVLRPLDLHRGAYALKRVFRIEVAQLAEIEPGPLLDLT